MKQVSFPLIVGALLALLPTSQAGNLEAIDRFQLWNDCEPIKLGIKTLSEDAVDIGLDKDAIAAAARRHLDEANLYKGEVTLKSTESSFPPPSMLYVAVHVVDRAFGVDIDFKKWMRDFKTDEIRLATSWQIGTTGTHGRISAYVLSVVSAHTKRLVNEYLRVNEDACKP